MKALGHTISENKLGLTFCLLILVYMCILTFELSGRRLEFVAFPLIFLTITSVCALLKIILHLTNSALVRRVDEIGFFKLEIKKPSPEPWYEKTKLKRELLSTISIALFVLLIYLIGFLPSTAIFSFLVTYHSFRNIKISIITCILATAITFLFDLIFPGGLWQGILLGA